MIRGGIADAGVRSGARSPGPLRTTRTLATSPQRAPLLADAWPLKCSPRLADAVGGVGGGAALAPPDQFGRHVPLATSPQAQSTPRRCGGGVSGEERRSLPPDSIQMTGREMSRAHLARRRALHAAAVEGHGAARMEATALGHVERARHLALGHDALGALGWIGHGHRG